MVLVTRFDSATNGNIVQCGEIGNVGSDTTFVVALGYGGDAASALWACAIAMAARRLQASPSRPFIRVTTAAGVSAALPL